MKPRKSFRNILSLSALTLIVFNFALPSTQAATLTWSGTGTWDDGTTSNWGTVSGGPYTASAWVGGSAALFEGTSGAVTVDGAGIASIDSINFSSTGYTLGGGNLTLTGTGGNVTVATGATGTINSIIGGSVGLTKDGLGTLVVAGANTYTGTTNIKGGTLQVGDGATGSLNGTTGTPLTFTNTGTLNVKEAAGSNQGMGALTLSAGDATVTSTGIAAQNSTLTFASLSTRPAGATGNFTLATNTTAGENQIVLTSTTNAPLDNSGSSNQGIFFGTTEYARYDTANNRFRAVAYGTDTNAPSIVGTGTTLGIDDATKDVKVSGNITAQTTASINTLNKAATTLTLSDTAQVLSVNGILATGGAIATTGSTITTAGKIQPAVAGGELVINTASGTLNLTAVIQDNTSASSLTKSGTGQLTLSNSASTYTGGTIVNAGTVGFTNNTGANTDTYFGSGPVTFNPGTTLALNRVYVGNNLTLNNATVTSGNSFASTLAGSTITLSGISTFSVSGGLSIPGNMTGSGSLIKTNTTFKVPLTGTNTYTGTTTINQGGLVFMPQSLYNGNSSQWTPANITVASGAVLGLFFGGGSDFTDTQINTLFGNLTTGLANNGMKAGSTIAIDTTNGSGTYGNNITDSTGTGGGAIGFAKFGGNTLTLSGNNTFTGPVSIGFTGIPGGTLRVYSFNSVNGGSPPLASSSLGRPTTVANGTITCGNNGNNQSCTLVYLGTTGETTDRVLSMNAGVSGGTALTLDQSGSGLLKFTSSIINAPAPSNRNRTLVLQGSTSGTGELEGSIANGTLTNYTSVTKTGTGTWTLSGANTYQPVSAAGGVTTIAGGCLVLNNASALPGGIGVTGGLSPLTFGSSGSNGGVLGLGVGDFTRSLAAAGTATGVNFTGNGGWAAYGADRVVNLGGASATITWATASTGLNGKTLILGNATSTHTVDFQNPLDMGSAARTVQVDDGSAAIDGKLSGILSGTAGGLTKTGAGTLSLTAANTYAGTTTVSAGTLQLGANNVLPDSANVSLAAATLNADTRTDTTGTLDVTAGATINLGTGAALAFANSSAVDWTGGTLNITGTLGATSIRFGTDNTGLNSGQLAVISVNGTGTGTYTLDTNGYLVSGSSTPYDTWAAGTFANPPFSNTAPSVDFDNDGLSNLLEFVLGGDPTISQAGIAPSVSTSGSNLVVSFKRSDASELAPAVSVKVELSTDLTFSTPAQDITIGAVSDPGPIAPSGASYTVSNSGGFDTITVTIPQGSDPKKFARVQAIKP